MLQSTFISSDKRLTRVKCLLHEGFMMISVVGLVCDAIIYVLLHQDFRDVVVGWFSSWRRNVTPQINQYNVTYGEQRVTTNV